jgi:hypothetical protein
VSLLASRVLLLHGGDDRALPTAAKQFQDFEANFARQPVIALRTLARLGRDGRAARQRKRSGFKAGDLAV